MEILPFALLLLLAALSADAQPAEVTKRYKHFLTQHVIGPNTMNENQCDKVIGERKISKGDTNDCKETNTFILATSDQVRAVCQDAGRGKGGNLYESTKRFFVITCKLRSGDRHPRCVYRGQKTTRTITLGCDRGWPVHYDEDTRIIG